LDEFLAALDKSIDQAIEFRHKSWYDEGVYKILREHGIGYCIVSCPDFPLHIEVTGDVSYIRWHGKEKWYRSKYSSSELNKWARIIHSLERKVDRVYGYFNNDFNCYAPKNCGALLKILGI
jgi:uncharacterized protein YecE (DUF72 family)